MSNPQSQQSAPQPAVPPVQLQPLPPAVSVTMSGEEWARVIELLAPAASFQAVYPFWRKIDQAIREAAASRIPQPQPQPQQTVPSSELPPTA